METRSETRSRTLLTAFFDSPAEAARAEEALAAAGIGRDRVRLLPEGESAARTAGAAYDHRRDEGGFWASLADAALPDEDRYAYAEGMSRGGATVSVRARDEAEAERAGDVLERHGGAVDMDERERAWRAEGWPGLQGAAAPSSERIPVVEEALQVAKRQVVRGRVRVRTYVVEERVEVPVTLREEHVHVERRPVDRPATPDDPDVYRERTIVEEEHGEEPVVSKHARVKEELVIRTAARERTETVRDTVRRTEVEVEDERDRTPGREPGRGR
jgi:uncharacterized protein (TIGR02271 family)